MSGGGRLAWVDAARGIGVALVVFGHVWRGLESARILRDQALFEIVDGAIYLFHMPLFFLLSGLTFAGGARRTPPGAFLRARGWRLLYPMVVWTYVLLLFRALFSSYSNRDVGFEDLLRWPLPPYELFWFLWALLLAQLLVYALLRGAPGRAGPALTAAAGLAALLFRQDLPFAHEWLNGVLRSLPAFALGVIIGPAVLAGSASARQGIAAAAGLALCIGLHLGIGTEGAARLLLGGAAALCCTLAIRAFIGATPPAHGPVARAATPLSVIGAASMAVFLTHILFAGMARSALSAAGVRDVWIHAGLGTAAGLVGPLIALWAARKLKLARLAGF